MSLDSERPLDPADDPARSERGRLVPTWTDPLAASASRPFGGPLGKHAAVGRHWFWTALRVAMLLAITVLVLGWFGKAACIQQSDTGNGQVGLDWGGNRPYVAMCYSDVVPLYGAEQLDNKDFLPYRDGWLEVTENDKSGQVTLYGEGDGRYRVSGQVQGTSAGGEPFALADGDVITVKDAHSFQLPGGGVVQLRGDSTVRFMEYPVLTGLFQWVNAKLTSAWLAGSAEGLLPGALNVAVYFNITALFLAFAWLATVWAVARSAPKRSWDAVLVAISPLVAVHAFTNFDTLATALAAGAIFAWARRRPVLAGVLLGLGAAVKLYPLFLLGPLLVLCLRAGKLRTGLRTTGVTVFTWIAVNLPVALAYPQGWREFFRMNSERDMDPDSLYNVVRYFSAWEGFDGRVPPGVTPTLLNAISGGLFVALCAGVVWVALSAPVRPRLAQLCFLVVAAFLLTNKVWSPQYSLWLVPLAVLALPNARLLLGWMAIDALVWAPRMYYYLGVDNKGLPEGWFLGTVILRDLAVVFLCAVIVRQIYRPSTDLVRENGDDDPAGGVLDRARDVVVIRTPGTTPRSPRESVDLVG